MALYAHPNLFKSHRLLSLWTLDMDGKMMSIHGENTIVVTAKLTIDSI